MIKKPWETKWKIVGAIGGGGQGSTHKVESLSDQSLACMKLLSDYKSPERRERFRRECVALETLDIARIPRFIESNSDRFRSDERLYLVTEYINGPTLSKVVESGTLVASDALKLVIDLLNTIEYVHSRDVVHRDLKPDNIILRGGDLGSPVIVDFGLSFNEEVMELNTATIQQIGNRFLHLPELQIESGDKRNPISDLTQITGILLFLLTGYAPVVLYDDRGRFPHQRELIRQNLTQLPQDLATAMLAVFDRGFNHSLSERWQSASQFRSRLEHILEPSSYAVEDDYISVFSSKLLASPENTKRQLASDVFEAFRETVGEVFRETLEEFEGTPIICGTNSHTSMATLTYTSNQYLTVKNFSDFRTLVAVSCSVVGNEVIVRTSVDQNPEQSEIGRLSNPPRDWADVRISLRAEILRVVREVIAPQLSI